MCANLWLFWGGFVQSVKTLTDEVPLEVWVGVYEVILYVMGLRTNLSCYFLSGSVFFYYYFCLCFFHRLCEPLQS